VSARPDGRLRALQVAAPFWLDRRDGEAVEIAVEAAPHAAEARAA
jgi:hypothetical protein